MRTLNTFEVEYVAGSNGDSGSEILNVCNNNSYPDSATITYSATNGSSLGLGDSGVSNSTTVSATLTCGELRANASQDSEIKQCSINDSIESE